MAHYFLGVDGGGSHTRALLCDEQGRVVGVGQAGPSNYQDVGEAAAGEALRGALTAARGSIPSAAIGAAFFGMAGVVNAADHAAVRRMATGLHLSPDAAVGVDHDIRIALAGGLAGRPGIALIVGTGSAAYGRTADGRAHQCGGWGTLADDVGSGSWLGRAALQEAVRQADGRHPLTPLGKEVFGFLGIERIEDFMHRVYGQGLSRTEMARLAPVVMGLYDSGDPAARRLVCEGRDLLVELVTTTARVLALPGAEIVFAGGLTQHPGYRGLLVQGIAEALPEARVVPARLSPGLGALIEALSLGGITISESHLKELATSFNNHAR